MPEKLIFEISSPGRRGVRFPECDVPKRPLEDMIPKRLQRTTPPRLPEVSELDIVRHFTRLSHLNYSVDTNFYPLGSCTMKYNPKVHEDIAGLEGFKKLHPYQPHEQVQGVLRLLYDFSELLKEVCGMPEFSLQPAAGAQGELLGMMITRVYYEKKGEPRRKIIIPDSAHGTNPASAALCGFEVVEIKSNKEGMVDLEVLKKAMSPEVAALMITNPNTLGIFEKEIRAICDILHAAGGLVYCDGANLNALLGRVKPGDMGIDLLHLNLHKTFTTPHGGGGPGAGPLGVSEPLRPFLPIPRVEMQKGTFIFNYNFPDSVGRLKPFYGNIGIIIRAYAYILSLGREGLGRVSEAAVLNANYLKKKLSQHYDIPYPEGCMHEFVLSGRRQKRLGVTTMDIAKRLLDYGFYAPTIYFPLIVEEALMIEPTETESRETLDDFAQALVSIAEEAEKQPELVKGAPHNTPVRRLDEVKAARQLDLRWSFTGDGL
ncbi:MAG: aminomethyl-transferring glycine dehydrogenase subunit GcvPB [Candidatus Brocadiales bacterium]|nr:aminomethyl-transferring glycine dehydrogenase subunit GcvPB [Candidatus Brocadiales bacterium]